jgi:Arc/MetJ-type ribon-helix-helix transcriptional regulator
VVEKLILDGQKDYSEPCLFYTNPSNDRFFMLRDKKIVSTLKTLSEFVRDLLSLVPGLMFEEEEEKEEEPEVVITPQTIVDAQMKAIFEQPVKEDSTTRRKSKRRGGF